MGGIAFIATSSNSSSGKSAINLFYLVGRYHNLFEGHFNHRFFIVPEIESGLTSIWKKPERSHWSKQNFSKNTSFFTSQFEVLYSETKYPLNIIICSNLKNIPLKVTNLNLF